MAGTVKALTTAHIGRAGGADLVVEEGSDWPADDPIVKANPALFEAPAAKRGQKPAKSSD